MVASHSPTRTKHEINRQTSELFGIRVSFECKLVKSDESKPSSILPKSHSSGIASCSADSKASRLGKGVRRRYYSWPIERVRHYYCARHYGLSHGNASGSSVGWMDSIEAGITAIVEESAFESFYEGILIPTTCSIALQRFYRSMLVMSPFTSCRNPSQIFHYHNGMFSSKKILHNPDPERLVQIVSKVFNEIRFIDSWSTSVCFGARIDVQDCEYFPLMRCSKGFENDFGYVREDIIGKNCSFLNRSVGDHITAEGRKQMRAFHKLELVHGDCSSTEVVLVNCTKSGTKVVVHVTLMLFQFHGVHFGIGIQQIINSVDDVPVQDWLSTPSRSIRDDIRELAMAHDLHIDLCESSTLKSTPTANGSEDLSKSICSQDSDDSSKFLSHKQTINQHSGSNSKNQLENDAQLSSEIREPSQSYTKTTITDRSSETPIQYPTPKQKQGEWSQSNDLTHSTVRQPLTRTPTKLYKYVMIYFSVN